MNNKIDKLFSIRIFSILIVAFILLRGINLSIIQMPFEGWDEYQHLAVADYIVVQGNKPNYGDYVPYKMYEFLTRHPHPPASAMQLSRIGAKNYHNKVWNDKDKKWVDSHDLETSKPRIYQAQHGPIYYYVVAGLRTLGTDLTYEVWADSARLLNVIFAVLAVFIWIKILRIYCNKDQYLVYLVILMVSVNSLYAYNYAHIANDSLAILLLSIALLLFSYIYYSNQKVNLIYVFVLGLIVGLSAITKATTLVLIPLVLLFFLYRVIRHKEYRYLSGLVLFALGYITIAGMYHAESLTKYGSLTGMQEALINKKNNKGLIDLVSAIPELEFSYLKGIFLYGHFKFGAWSDIRADKWIRHLNQYYIWIVFLALCISMFYEKYRIRLLEQVTNFMPLLLLLMLTWLAMMYHGLHTQLAWGSNLARAPYAMAAFPVFCLVLVGLGILGQRRTTLIAVIYIVLLSLAYYSGLLNLLEVYSPNLTTSEAIQYVQSHHSTLAQKYPIQLGLVIELIILGYLFTSVLFLTKNNKN